MMLTCKGQKLILITKTSLSLLGTFNFFKKEISITTKLCEKSAVASILKYLKE